MTAPDGGARAGPVRRLARVVAVLLVAVGLLAAGVVVGIRVAGGSLEIVVGPSPAGPPPTAPAGGPLEPSPAPSGSPAVLGGPTAVLVGAGDIAACGSANDQRTAKLIEAVPGIVFTAGDNAYENGTAKEFERCYDPTWGRFRARTRPAIGNHDAYTDGGAAYFAYFGASAGTAPDGWYSYEAGTWHVIVLNSNCASIGGCDEGSPQLTWLQADLAAHPAACTMAIWHHPRFSSGEHGSDPITDPFWQVLYAARVELIVNGHDHDYERFAPQTPAGEADPVNGIREIVVGTGGKSLRVFRPTMVANSEVADAYAYGVLRLDLLPGSYAWRFIPVADAAFTDGGGDVCH
jgi:hypothetical protein